MSTKKGGYRPFSESYQQVEGFNRLFTGESGSFCHCIDDVGFGEGAGYWHGRRSSFNWRLQVSGKGLICQLKDLVMV